jgi:hypothetical protein
VNCKELQDVFAKLEPEMGIAGILSELADFTGKCSLNASGCNDVESAKTYRDDKVKIEKLAVEIRENDR